MRIGLVHNWPGTRNAELDLIGRMSKVLANMGHEAVPIDPFGNALEVTSGSPLGGPPIEGPTLDFCINLHFSNPQLLDCFSYVVNWNPVGYLLRNATTGTPFAHEDLLYLSACLAGHDVVLSAGSAKADQLIATLAAREHPAKAFPEARLHTTCQMEDVSPVSLDSFRVFYIGVNWERIADASHTDRRHGGLLDRLDDAGRVDFYGVRQVCGIDPWKGFNNYRGELPFDGGLSIIRTANRCGVSLVLSSPQHRESGLVSSRIFQACAARTVIISDDNAFIAEHFGEAVLTFEYSGDAEISCERISELIDWIEQHPSEALEKAERAYRIFSERFALDRELRRLLDHHALTRKSALDRVLPAERTQLVDVICNLQRQPLAELERVIDNLNRQQHVALHAIVFAEADGASAATELLRARAEFAYTLAPQPPKGTGTGTAVLVAASDLMQGDCFCIDQPGVHWHHDHLARLLRLMRDGPDLVSQSHVAVQNEALHRHAYNESLASLAIGGELMLLRPDHLAAARMDLFSSAAFLFHRQLVTDQLPRAENLALFDLGTTFFLLTLNYVAHGGLPEGTGRVTLCRRRADDLFALYDMDDPEVVDAMHTEGLLLGSLFRGEAAMRELIARHGGHGGLGAERVTGATGSGLYGYLIKTLRNRPRLLRGSISIYDGLRAVLRLPPHPPRKSPRKGE